LSHGDILLFLASSPRLAMALTAIATMLGDQLEDAWGQATGSGLAAEHI